VTTDAIWTTFSGRLRGFIAKRVRKDVDIDDILQDVFAKIHAGLGTLKEGEKLEAWLFQVTRRAIIDHFRSCSGKRRAVDLLGDVAEKAAPEDLSAVVASWLDPMMSLLPDEDREALRLTDLEGMSQKDLAARLGISVTGAKSRVQRARARLKKAVLDCCHLELDRRGTPIDYSKKQGDCGTCSCE
jgi:RNA polymerase sigma-70 factor, ECF subfamily